MNKIKIFISLIALLVGVLGLALPACAGPWQVESGEFTLAKNEIIEGDLIFAGERVEIDGTIHGDLLLFVEEAVINGRVEGSVLGAVGGKLTINGVLGGSLRGLFNEAHLTKNGVIKGSVSALALKLIADRDSIIEEGVLGRFSESDLQGGITGPVSINCANSTKLGGAINGDLQIGGAPIKWVAPLTVTGKVTDSTGYDNDPAKLKGIRLINGYQRQKPLRDRMFIFKGLAVISFIWFVGSLLISLVWYKLFPRTTWIITEPTAGNFRRSLLTGLLSVVGLPILIILLSITVVGIPLALLLGIFYLVLLLFAGIPVNLWLGRLIFKSKLNPVPMIVLGSLIMAVIGFFPIINLLIRPLLLVNGIGMIVGNIRLQVNQRLNPKIDA